MRSMGGCRWRITEDGNALRVTHVKRNRRTSEKEGSEMETLNMYEKNDSIDSRTRGSASCPETRNKAVTQHTRADTGERSIENGEQDVKFEDACIKTMMCNNRAARMSPAVEVDQAKAEGLCQKYGV